MIQGRVLEREIVIGSRKINYLVRSHRRSKHIRLSIGLDGRLLVSQPRFVLVNQVENFIREKASWVLKNLDRFAQSPTFNYSHQHYLKNRAQARFLVEEKLNFFNQIYQLSFNRFSIKNQRRCWGSCSKKGNLNFNYKIIFLPSELADLIIVHELCHLAEFNHSPKFWQLVKQAIPDYRDRRQRLRQEQFNFGF